MTARRAIEVRTGDLVMRPTGSTHVMRRQVIDNEVWLELSSGAVLICPPVALLHVFRPSRVELLDDERQDVRDDGHVWFVRAGGR